LCLAALMPSLAACDENPGVSEIKTSAIVYGPDDRQEYFEIPSQSIRLRVAESMVALVPSALLVPGDNTLSRAKPWQEVDGLCSDERFADQPSLAFCSGLLVERDLVLAAGHCARLLAPAQIAVVFGYYYRAAGELAIGPGDIINVSRIVSESTAHPNGGQREDYAWFQLSSPAREPRSPVSLGSAHVTGREGESIIFVGASGGVPLKIDSGARVRNSRSDTGDYFTADTDTFRGASGGAAFNQELVPIGILARGGEDFVLTPEGCKTSVRRPASEITEEEFTYLGRAVEALCVSEPSRSVCRTYAEGTDKAQAGCSLVSLTDRASASRGKVIWALFLVVSLMARSRARQFRGFLRV
ncbi:MAG TPA: serine protease, partial [Polyangia bacterium]